MAYLIWFSQRGGGAPSAATTSTAREAHELVEALIGSGESIDSIRSPMGVGLTRDGLRWHAKQENNTVEAANENDASRV